jgi:hypothetical protein
LESDEVNPPSSSSSASTLLLDLRKQQNEQLQQIESAEFLPFQSNNTAKTTALHDQIANSEICHNPKLVSLVQHNGAADAHKYVSKAKRKKIDKGVAYQDKALDKFASKSLKKQRVDRMKNIY